MIVTIKSKQELDNLVSQGNPVAVDFWAAWCGPCRQLGKTLHDIDEQKSLGENLTIAKVNVDEQQALASEYGVTSIPLVVMFNNGKPVKGLLGARPRAAMEADMRQVITA